MRLLDRYLLRELLVPLGYCLAGFLIFWISFDLISELGDFQQLDLGPAQIAKFYLVKIPEFVVLVMPIALLLASLYALTNHARHHELTAMRAAGVSLPRLTLPYTAVGLVFSLVLFALNELWVPQSEEIASEIRQKGEETGEHEGADGWEHRLHFRNARDGRIWNIAAFHLETFAMKNPQVEWEMADGSRRTLIATDAIRTNGAWTFFNVQEFTYTNSPAEFEPLFVRTDSLTVPEFSESPSQIKSEIKVNRLKNMKSAKEVELSIREIWDYLRLHPDVGPGDEALLKTQLHYRLAAPWTCLVVVAIAIPFGARSGRRNVFVGVASSLFICFSFFILLRLGLALGAGGYVPPWVAGWMPNLLFAGTGFFLLWRLK